MEPLPRNQPVRTAGPPPWMLAGAGLFLVFGVVRLTFLTGNGWDLALGLGNILVAVGWVAVYLRIRQLSRRPTRGADPSGFESPPRHRS